MKKMAVLLFTDIEHDSRVQRTVSSLLDMFDIDIFCRDNNTSIDNVNLKFFHNRYSDNDANLFESRDMFPVKFIKKLIYYIDTEKMKLRSIIDSHYNVYYCNDFNTLIAGFLASRIKRAKLVYDAHELWAERSGAKRTLFNRMKRLIEMGIEHMLIRKCNLVITVSDGIADELVIKYGVKRPLVLRNIPIRKDLPDRSEISSLRQSLNIPHNSIVVVYQGSMTEHRGILELIHSMDILPENIHLLLMGPHPDNKLLMAINKCDRIHYPGFIPLLDLHMFTACGDIGIAPIIKKNVKSYELALPNKFLQYMNAGLALCLYDVPESRELIENCQCGRIINSITPQNIARSIESLTDGHSLMKMKMNSRNYFIKSFIWLKEIKKLKDVLSDI